MVRVIYNTSLMGVAVFNAVWLIRQDKAGSTGMACTMLTIGVHLSALLRLFSDIATLQWTFPEPSWLTVPNFILAVYWFGGAIPHYIQAIRFALTRKRQRDRLYNLYRKE